MENFLKECDKQYYLGTPIISDAQYDALREACGKEDVGSTTSGIPHLFRMYSLQKYYEGEGTPPVLSGKLVSTPKLDGAAISILYHNGVMIRALTRGDGIIGEDIFEKIYNLDSVPNTILNKETIQVTGEIVASKDIPNSRNYASGALNLKSLDEFLKREINFVAYGVMSRNIEGTGNYLSHMSTLDTWGFDSVISLNENNLPYPTDGVVFRVDSNQVFEEMGYTSKHPRGAWAIKVRTEGVETTLLDVIWQVGKSGKVTPVGILEPVEIDGAVVKRVTLNNIGFIRGLNLSIGDNIMVERSGGIIPRIISKAV